MLLLSAQHILGYITVVVVVLVIKCEGVRGSSMSSLDMCNNGQKFNQFLVMVGQELIIC